MVRRKMYIVRQIGVSPPVDKQVVVHHDTLLIIDI